MDSMANNKYYSYYLLLNHWLESNHYGHTCVDFFEEEKISTIAIYGMSDMANRLIEELKGSNIKVVYGIDRDVAVTTTGMSDIYSPDECLPEVDAVVITPINAYEQIRALLEQKLSSRFYSLEEVIWSI